MIYVEANCFWPGGQFWHEDPFRVRNRILSSPVVVHSKWQLPSNHCEYAIDVSCSSRSRRLTFVFSCFPLVDGKGNWDWRQNLPLYSNTAFRLCMEESMNSCHSSGMYLMFIVVVRPSTYTELTLCNEELLKLLLARERWCYLHSVLQNIQLWMLEDISSAVFFESWRSLTRSESSFCAMLCGLAEVAFRKYSVSSAER